MLTEVQLEALEAQLPAIYKRLATYAVELVKRTRRRHGDLPAGEEGGDLLQAALAALTVGKRSWPEGVELEVVLKEIIKSLNSHRWESPAAREVSLDRLVASIDSDPLDDPYGEDLDQGIIPGSFALYRWTAEELYALRERQAQIMDQIMAAMPDDEPAWRVARCIINGLTKRAQIALELRMTENQVHAMLRRLRRRLEHLRPEWRPP